MKREIWRYLKLYEILRVLTCQKFIIFLLAKIKKYNNI